MLCARIVELGRGMVWLVVCGIFAAVIAFVLTLKAIIGDDSETRALRERLKFHDIEPKRFSSSCLTELIEIETRHLRIKEHPIEHSLKIAIDKVALDIRNITLGHGRFDKDEIESNPLWAVLKKHDPARFGIDNLEKTQALYRDIVLGKK